MIRKYHNHKLQTNPWHREEGPRNNHEIPGRPPKQSNAINSLYPIEMIAKLEQTQSNAQQNIRTIRRAITESHNNNKSTTTELPPWNGQQPKPLGGGGRGGLNIFCAFISRIHRVCFLFCRTCHCRGSRFDCSVIFPCLQNCV